MTELAEQLLVSLFAATLFLSLGTGVLAVVLRVGRVRSPGVHRFAWVAAVLLGWVFVPIRVVVPWYEADAPAEIASLPPVEYRPLDAGAATFAPLPTAGSEAAVSEALPSTPVQAPEPTEPAASSLWTVWPLAVAACWLAGILACVAYGAWNYGTFLRRFPVGEQENAAWQQQWRDLLRASGVRRSIPLCLTDGFGPALCRLPRGYALAVPANLWRTLTTEQRAAILAHELAHYRRGDVWKSLAMRLLALPHWFNPLAWYAARRFDECGEWACDEAVRRTRPEAVTTYASALLNLSAAPHGTSAFSTAARGHGLALRVRRLLSDQPMEDSKMKKLIVASVALALVAVCAVRIELVAQEAGGDDLPPGADANGPGLKHAQDMVKFAEEAYKGVNAEYELGRVLMDGVYIWSRRWLDAELTLTEQQWRGNAEKLQAGRSDAFARHLFRMEQLHTKVAALRQADAIGGEHSNYYGTKFFVAEAKLWVAHATNSTD